MQLNQDAGKKNENDEKNTLCFFIKHSSKSIAFLIYIFLENM